MVFFQYTLYTVQIYNLYALHCTITSASTLLYTLVYIIQYNHQYIQYISLVPTIHCTHQYLSLYIYLYLITVHTSILQSLVHQHTVHICTHYTVLSLVRLVHLILYTQHCTLSQHCTCCTVLHTNSHYCSHTLYIHCTHLYTLHCALQHFTPPTTLYCK